MIAFAIRDPQGFPTAVPPQPLEQIERSDSLLHRRVQVPDRDEELELLSKAQSGDISARNELIERNMPFLIKTAYFHYKFRGRPGHLEHEDLLQSCFFGMVRAIEKYEIGKARGRFIGYAKYWVRHFMDQEIHYSKAYRVPSSVMFQYERGQVKGEKTLQAIERFRDMMPLGDDYDAEDRHPVITDILLLQEQVSVLRAAMAKLPEASWLLLKERYMEGQTLQQMGKSRNLTRERIRQMLEEIERTLIDACRDYVMS